MEATMMMDSVQIPPMKIATRSMVFQMLVFAERDSNALQVAELRYPDYFRDGVKIKRAIVEPNQSAWLEDGIRNSEDNKLIPRMWDYSLNGNHKLFTVTLEVEWVETFNRREEARAEAPSDSDTAAAVDGDDGQG